MLTSIVRTMTADVPAMATIHWPMPSRRGCFAAAGTASFACDSGAGSGGGHVACVTLPSGMNFRTTSRGPLRPSRISSPGRSGAVPEILCLLRNVPFLDCKSRTDNMPFLSHSMHACRRDTLRGAVSSTAISQAGSAHRKRNPLVGPAIREAGRHDYVEFDFHGLAL